MQEITEILRKITEICGKSQNLFYAKIVSLGFQGLNFLVEKRQIQPQVFLSINFLSGRPPVLQLECFLLSTGMLLA